MFRALRHPTRLLPAAFLAALLAGTGLLMLPAARAAGEPAPPLWRCSPPPRRCASPA